LPRIRSSNFNSVAPPIAGTAIRKENFAESARFTPQVSPAAIVLPAREIPGKIAIA